MLHLENSDGIISTWVKDLKSVMHVLGQNPTSFNVLWSKIAEHFDELLTITAKGRYNVTAYCSFSDRNWCFL